MPQFSANLTFLYREFPLPERFALAATDGFRAVEILTPENVPVPELADAARKAKVQVALCNAPMGDLFGGGPGLSGVPGREADFRHAIETAIEWAELLDCPRVHIGPSRVPEGCSPDECMDVLSQNLKLAASLLTESGIMTLIEPLNSKDMPDICLSTVQQALQLMDVVDHPGVRLQFDVYHAARTGPEYMRALEQNIDQVGHIQFADVPGRGEPGTGELPFDRLFALVDSLDYTGWMGAEYQPSDSSASLEWFEPFRDSQAAPKPGTRISAEPSN
jgi:hydroxypyruvate isomerase